MKKVIKLKSDNFNCLVTKEAYKEIRLQMSTGDFHTHKAREVTVKNLNNVYTLEHFLDDELNNQGQCSFCGNIK